MNTPTKKGLQNCFQEFKKERAANERLHEHIKSNFGSGSITEVNRMFGGMRHEMGLRGDKDTEMVAQENQEQNISPMAPVFMFQEGMKLASTMTMNMSIG